MGSVAFLFPWALGALAVLPALWWLLRLMPPRPRHQVFPALRLLRGLETQSQAQARPPWWLTVLRLVVAGMLIVAASAPVLNPSVPFRSRGPLLLVIDDGWAAAPRWADRQALLDDLLARAERQGKPVIVQTTAPQADGLTDARPPAPIGPVSAAAARDTLGALVPRPWAVDRDGAAQRLVDGLPAAEAAMDIVWLSDGLDAPGSERLRDTLRRRGQLRLYRDDPADPPLLLRPPARDGAAVSLRVERPAGGQERPVTAIIRDRRGLALLEIPGRFDPGQTVLDLAARLPNDTTNSLRLATLAQGASAAATVLVDSAWRRPRAGLVLRQSDGPVDGLAHPLYYLQRALLPYAELSTAPLDVLLADPPEVIFYTGTLPDAPALRARLADWIARGGVLIRFAQNDLAAGEEPLLPVRLRRAERAVGGTLSWARPQRLGPMPDTGPFVGLRVPDDVTVSRQLLAEPGPALVEAAWARLADGTPLVTGRGQGRGWLVLFHVPPGPSWSTLPLSGLFVDMLRQLLRLADQRGDRVARADRPPVLTLDGFGRLGSAPATALPLPARPVSPGPRHPPGLYGLDGDLVALNLSNGIDTLRPLVSPAGGDRRYGGPGEIDLSGWLVAAALVLLALDALLSWKVTGRLAAAGMVFLIAAGPAWASGDDIPSAALRQRLGLISSGDDRADRVALSGLAGLSALVTRRSSVALAAPDRVDPAVSPLALYPLLYWPLSSTTGPLPVGAAARLQAYLDGGGLLLVDSRDRRVDSRLWRRALAGLRVPPLVPLPADHLLTRSFYLMQTLPGRYPDAPIWVEAVGEDRPDGVASMILGGNDWAAAWATDAVGAPLYMPVPDGERQRELAYRFGVNLVMYALTGNYKGDQVHLPIILERLAQ